MWLNEDEELYSELEDYYYSVDGDTPFYDLEDGLVKIVLNRLPLSQEEAYVFVCTWFDNRH